MNKNKCKVCGALFSEGNGFFVYDAAQEYFLCDNCARTSEPENQGDGLDRCGQCEDGVIEKGICRRCGAEYSAEDDR